MKLNQRVQQALSTYRCIDVTHPLYAAYSDWLYSRTHEDVTARCVALRRVCAELRFERTWNDDYREVLEHAA